MSYVYPLSRQVNVIHPTQYAHALKDIVTIHFTLKHWGFNSSDTNIADINIINMQWGLVPRPPRRKLALTGEYLNIFTFTADIIYTLIFTTFHNQAEVVDNVIWLCIYASTAKFKQYRSDFSEPASW